MKTEIKKDVKLNLLAHFSPDHSSLVELGREIGVSNLEQIFSILGGSKVHIPQSQHFWQKLAVNVRDEEIRNKFNGRNRAHLAAEYGLCDRQLRRIVNQ